MANSLRSSVSGVCGRPEDRPETPEIETDDCGSIACYALADDSRVPLRAAFFLGTFAPARRASDSPIAIACLRLLTVRPDRPLFNVPRLRSCIARSTFSDAFFEYLAIHTLRSRVSCL